MSTNKRDKYSILEERTSIPQGCLAYILA